MGHFWSLSIEENFYLFWPFVFIVSGKFRKVVTIFILVLVPMIRLYDYFYQIDWINELTPFYRIDAIVLGCFVALYKDRILIKISKYWTILFLCSVFLIIVIPYLPIIVIKHNYYAYLLFILFGETQGTFANVIIAIIMLYSIYGPKKTWYYFLNLKFMNYIGLLSYSLYLWQQFYIFESDHWYNQFPINIACLILTALLSYYLIEKPFLKIKAKF